MPTPVPRLRLVPLDESDEALLLATARGERAAFRQFADRHARRLRAFCARHVADASVAEDLAQDVLVTVWEARASFKGGDAVAWLYTLALNRCRKHLRSWKRWLRLTREPVVPPSPPPSPLDAVEQVALTAAVSAAVDTLPPGQREALALRFEAQLDYRAVGEVLGCSEGAARARTFEAIRTLRATFQEAP
ncbi:MAG: RNA polymerase sigma factor [Myxococcota bacterium]